MSERPILFSAPMVYAILDGRKTQTRRIIKRRGRVSLFHDGWTDDYILDPGNAEWRQKEVVFAPGDLLWVRETVCAEELEDGSDGVRYLADKAFNLIENTEAASMCWVDLHNYRGKRGLTVPPIHMPRWASRITLRVTEVRVQRLQDISGEDTIAEGVQCPTCEAMKYSACHDSGCFASSQAFKELWQSIHGPGSWDANPWVAAITFERVK